MRFTDSDIYADLFVDFDEISQATYIEEELRERADGYVPVYNNEIIRDWAEMPSEFDDAWQDFGIDGARGIVSLMSWDLANYYYERACAIWAEIVAEKAGK